MSGCPALAVPAGFGARNLPMGIQIVAPNRRELDMLLTTGERIEASGGYA